MLGRFSKNVPSLSLVAPIHPCCACQNVHFSADLGAPDNARRRECVSSYFFFIITGNSILYALVAHQRTILKMVILNSLQPQKHEGGAAVSQPYYTKHRGFCFFSIHRKCETSCANYFTAPRNMFNI